MTAAIVNFSPFLARFVSLSTTRNSFWLYNLTFLALSASKNERYFKNKFLNVFITALLSCCAPKFLKCERFSFGPLKPDFSFVTAFFVRENLSRFGDIDFQNSAHLRNSHRRSLFRTGLGQKNARGCYKRGSAGESEIFVMVSTQNQCFVDDVPFISELQRLRLASDDRVQLLHDISSAFNDRGVWK
ncbi:hypothetical protein MHBO_000319 [Bonamia ostreae]|uniref:Uncharacterized protein n=1 Tax=Bonamia ostreae TaxID=126728 RepID=A0ABV2AF88_9EUKA